MDHFRLHTVLESTLSVGELNRELLLEAKRMGYSDKQIAACIGSTELAVRSQRLDYSKACFILHLTPY